MWSKIFPSNCGQTLRDRAKLRTDNCCEIMAGAWSRQSIPPANSPLTPYRVVHTIVINALKSVNGFALRLDPQFGGFSRFQLNVYARMQAAMTDIDWPVHSLMLSFHDLRQKPMGSHDSGSTCWRTSMTLGRHGNELSNMHKLWDEGRRCAGHIFSR